MPERMPQSTSVRTNVDGGSPLFAVEAHGEADHYLHHLVLPHEANELSHVAGDGVGRRTHVTGDRDQGGGQDPVRVTECDPDADLTHINAQSPTPWHR
jgi:hypothetical protein